MKMNKSIITLILLLLISNIAVSQNVKIAKDLVEEINASIAMLLIM